MSEEGSPVADYEVPPLVAAFLDFAANGSNQVTIVGQTDPTNHDECSLEDCDHKRIATIKANAQLLDEMRKQVAALDRQVSEALVDLAAVQTIKMAMDALVDEVDVLRATVRRMQASPARETSREALAD